MSGSSRPALRYFGGKFTLAPWIVENMPRHRFYVEPFGGGASVLLMKEPVFYEVYNDLSKEIVDFFRILQNKSKCHELERRLRYTPYARLEFEEAYKATRDPIEKARRLIIRSFMGFGSTSTTKRGRTGFRAAGFHQGSPSAHSWANYWECLEFFHKRLQGVLIENRDASEVMWQQDNEETLHFVDPPPYVPATRKAHTKNSYQFDMTTADHERLCVTLEGLKGMVMLCGYENEIYNMLGWESISHKAQAIAGPGKKRDRTEVIWFNKKAWENRSQQSLF